MRKTVSIRFREALAKALPGLNKKVSYWRFMRCLLFGPVDKDTGRPLIDTYHIAKAEDKVSSFRGKNYVGKEFLEEFQLEVMTPATFSWSGWDYQQARARIAYLTLPEEIETLIVTELINTTRDRVYFDTGKRVTHSLAKTQREMIRVEAETYFEFALPQARPLLTYMNGLPPHGFSKVITKNWEAAIAKALQIEDPLKKRTQIEVLMTLQEDLQPFYKPSQKGCTPRIFPCNYSIPMLRRDVRKTLTKGWYEFDLANAQLAIVSRLWDIQPVQEFLSSGGSIWSSLFTHFNLNPDKLRETNTLKYQGIKDVFKTSLYSLIYGMPKANFTRELNQGLRVYGITQGGKCYFTHPVIEALYKARERRFIEMNELRETSTIFDTILLVEGGKTSNGKPTKERKDCIASILAHQAQSIELYVLLPVVELASTTKDFYITLWMHDGFSLHFNDHSKAPKWIERILTVVQEKIDELGIYTHLDWELL